MYTKLLNTVGILVIKPLLLHFFLIKSAMLYIFVDYALYLFHFFKGFSY